MLITNKNFNRYFPSEKTINIPRKEVLFTFSIHGVILFLGHLLFYNVLSVISIWIFVLEFYHGLTVTYKIWVHMGYSKVMFAIIWLLYFAVCIFGAVYLRELIQNFL